MRQGAGGRGKGAGGRGQGVGDIKFISDFDRYMYLTDLQTAVTPNSALNTLY